MTTQRFEQFVTLLGQLPAETWAASVNKAPSCLWLKPFSQVWPFGRFAGLYVLLGLNNYQLKGRAEVGYWPKVVPLISRVPIPTHPRELREMLLSFYRAERMGARKVSRLECFLGSKLCRHIWEGNATTVAAEFLGIWSQLACTMNQEPEMKTIVFAMKCLAYALVLVNELGFDFGPIPIPVDSRVCELSRRLGLASANDDTERARWNVVLDRIHSSNPAVTMIHLDSILWQTGTLSKQQIATHLHGLGAHADLARSIADVIDRQ